MSPQPGRKKRRFLAPQEKFEIWMQLVRGEITVGDAADKNRVDRATISKLKDVAQKGALEALAASRPAGVDPTVTALLR
jgi:transposase